MQQIINPLFKDKTAICFACDDKYVPFFLVALTSLCKYSNKNNNYDIVILESGISKKNKKIITNFSKSNISIKFIDMIEYLKNFDVSIFYTSDHFTVHTYYRFFITDIFQEYEKVLYLDSDILLQDDIACLLKTDLTGCYVGATKDIYLPMICNVNQKLNNYFTKELNLKNVRNYFQAGVLMFNIKYCRENDLKNKLIKRLKEVKTPFIVDQDILNSVCENYVKYFDGKWNFDTNVTLLSKEFKNLLENTYSEEELKIIKDIQKYPKIIHFAGSIKPWLSFQICYAFKYWTYILKSKKIAFFVKNYLFNRIKKILLLIEITT